MKFVILHLKDCSVNIVLGNATIRLETRLQNYEAQQKRALARKHELIMLKGGKCEICGYSKNYAALSFHHLDPTQKELSLDARTLSGSRMEILKDEVSKCQLLCQNCHMEIHYPTLTLGETL